MINAWGDSYRANEFYDVARPSVIDNNFLPVKQEGDDGVIVELFENDKVTKAANKLKRDAYYAKRAERAPVSTQPSTSVGGFQGYKGGFEDKGKGTLQGDGKDKAMRKVADGFIGEITTKNSSSNTSLTTINNKQQEIAKANGIPNPAKTFIEERGVTKGVKSAFTKTIMLARNAEFKNKPLTEDTKLAIRTASGQGIEFVVGDMPGVDSQFIDYLQEIGAKFTIYHTGPKDSERIKVIQPTQAPTADEAALKSQIAALEEKKKTTGLSPTEDSLLRKLRIQLGNIIKNQC
jgi:molybdopterin-guanine dinucleotide biosynthesis protein A